jgi:hypothetical protein
LIDPLSTPSAFNHFFCLNIGLLFISGRLQSNGTAFAFEKRQLRSLFQSLLDKGKPAERLGRKATGLNPAEAGYGSGVARQTPHLPNVLVVSRP